MGDADTLVFGEVALPLASMGWRPIPLTPDTKLPAEAGWNRYNAEQHNPDDLRQMASHHYECAVGIALPARNLALDLDITGEPEAAAVIAIADKIFGPTPLVRIGQSPKSVRLYRADGSVRASKPHPIELYSGSGQVAVFGWHQKAGRPYCWPASNPIEVRADSEQLPMVTDDQVQRFLREAEPTLAQLRKERRVEGGGGIGLDASQHLRELLDRGLPFRQAAWRILEGACEGGRHFAVRAVIGAGFNRGIDEEQIRRYIEVLAPPDLLALVTNDGYLERTLVDFAPRANNWK